MFKQHPMKANEQLNILGWIPTLLSQCVCFYIFKSIKPTFQNSENLF